MALAGDAENIFERCEVTLDLYSQTATKPGLLGSELRAKDGRRFRLCSSDSDIAAGSVVVNTNNAQAIAATYFGVDTSTAPAATEGGSIGDKSIRYCVTSGVTANEYAGGYLVIRTGTGSGYCYKVKSNEASASSGGAFIELYHPGLAVALDNTSVGILLASRFADVAIHTAANFGGDQNQIALGVCMAACTADTDGETKYFWVQVQGMAAVRSGAAVATQGGILSPAEDDNGSVQTAVEADGEYSYQALGVAVEDHTDTYAEPAMLLPQGV